MRLTVVLPFYNEEALLASLPGVLDRLRAALSDHEVRILAVDDGSRDGTAAGLDKTPGIEVITHPQNRGVGGAMRTGIENATGDAVLVYDPDEPYPAPSLAELVAGLEHGDLVTLSPYHPLGAVEGVPWGRLLLSRGASRLYRWRMRQPLHTYTCAVRAYRLPGARELVAGMPTDFTAAAYLVAAAVARGWRIHEVPAVLRPRPAGRSKMRLFRTIRSHLRLLGDLPVTPKNDNTGS